MLYTTPLENGNRGSDFKVLPLDYVRTSSFIFFLSFKPSEPHLTRYLVEVKNFTHAQVNDDIYPVYTYVSMLLLVALAIAHVSWFSAESQLWFLRDKVLILVGSAGRCSVRVLLLFGESLISMQVMQVVFALGTAAEVVFYAYVLKIVPLQHCQRLTAVTQGCYLIAHTSAGLLGDFLLANTGIGLVGLMWISACSVFVAAFIACTFRSPDAQAMRPRISSPGTVLRLVYTEENFGMYVLWWTLSYSVYMTVYGYEASLYAKYTRTSQDLNGCIFAIGCFSGAVGALTLSFKVVEFAASRRILFTFFVVGTLMTVTVAFMGLRPRSEVAVAGGFAVFFLSWSFGNALFYGETRRSIHRVVHMQKVRDLVLLPEATLQSGDSCDSEDNWTALAMESIVMQLTSVAVMVNSSVATVVQSLFSLIFLTWMNSDIASIFRYLAIMQCAIGGLVIILVAVQVRVHCSQPARLTELQSSLNSG